MAFYVRDFKIVTNPNLENRAFSSAPQILSRGILLFLIDSKSPVRFQLRKSQCV